MIIVLATFILAARVHAAPAPDFCYEKCTARQRLIWSEYQNGSPVRSSEIPEVFSGACYHAAPWYDPEHEHYGVAVFDVFRDKFVYGGEFTFFSESNPYAGMTLEQAKAKGLLTYDDRHLLVLHQDYAEADLHPGRPPIWHYWFKQSASGEELYLLAQWDTQQRVFCRLIRHHKAVKAPKELRLP